MITVFKTEKSYELNKELVELRGLSTDNKPTELNGKPIANGSQFIEINTGKVFLYNEQSEEWTEV